MGEVYLAQDTKLDRKVALKILPAAFCLDSERSARFLREAQAASGLNHPNICTIHEIDDDSERPFIAMEYIEGKTLAEMIKDDRLELAQTLDIALQIADALSETHARGIVHRDIKPSNIIVNHRGQVKILDFGLAKKTVVENEAETQQLLSQAGMILGTASYMSPEQARGLALDARTDVWSCGVVLYEMLSGEKPFVGATTTDLLAAILKSEPENVCQMVGGIPPELGRIVWKALRKARDERFQSARDLYADLKELKNQLDVAAARGVSAPLVFASGVSIGVQSAVEVRNSIAVLPFTNLSADAENEYFCDGLAEELLNALAKIEDLQVAARTSAFSFKGKNTKVSEIGNALNVKTVLEGSVRRSGNRLRITVQLVSAADGYHLWSECYDRELRNVFDVQDEITLAVVDALKVKLLGEERAGVLRHYIPDTEAYELFLRGRYYRNKHTIEGLLKAIEYFEKAVDIEPRYAAAHAEIGICFVMLSHFGLSSPHEVFPKGKAAAVRALELDNQSAEGHSALANILFYYEWNWSAAEREFKRAIELNPNDADTRWRFGLFLVSQGIFAKAISEAERAVKLDPLSLLANLYSGFIYLLADQLDRAFKQVARIIELAPSFPWAYWLKGSIYLAQEKYLDAAAALEKAAALGGIPVIKSYLGSAYGFCGKRDEALGVLKELLETKKQHFNAAFNIARIYNGLGDIDSACEWLAKSVDERNGEIVLLSAAGQGGMRNVWRTTLRADTRYQDILRRVGLPAAEIARNRAKPGADESPTEIILGDISGAKRPE